MSFCIKAVLWEGGSNVKLWDKVLGRILSRLLLHLGERGVRWGGDPGEEDGPHLNQSNPIHFKYVHLI